MIKKNSISIDDAFKAMEAMLKEASKDPTRPFAIAIVDNCGELILFAKQDGAQKFREEMAIKKAYTSAQFRRTTKAQQTEGFDPEGLNLGMFNLGTKFTTIPGGVPILKPGDENKELGQYRETVGAIGTSGARGDEDERIAMIGAKVLNEMVWEK